MTQIRCKYAPEFRSGAVQMVRETRKPIAQVARDLGIGAGVLGTWVRKDKIERDEAESLTPGRTSLERGWIGGCVVVLGVLSGVVAGGLRYGGTVMRAIKPEVVDAVWDAVKGHIPVRRVSHPLGCHRPRVSDKLCFKGILIRLVIGCSWRTAEFLLGARVSDTTLRARRDEWVKAGVFDALAAEAVKAYDRICGLDLTETSIDGSLHKAPCGGPGTGKNPCDRGKLGWKWSLATDANGIPVGWAVDGANRHDSVLFEPTLKSIEMQGLLQDIETLHLDRGYDSQRIRDLVAAYGIQDLNCAEKRKPGTKKPTKKSTTLGMRWTVERTNSWLSNYGQIRRNTDRQPKHRHAQLCLAITLIITTKLIDWRNRWNPNK